MSTPIGDAADAATGFSARRRNRKTAPQPVLSAPVQNRPEPPAPVQEDPVSSPVPAALAAVQHQAAAIEADSRANMLAVVLTARHVGREFTPAECVAVADFLAAIEAERRGQHQALAPYPAPGEPANGNGTRPTAPQAKALP